MTTHKDQDDRFRLSLSDIFTIFRNSRKKIFFCAFLFGALGVLWALIQPIRYEAEGTFREKGIKQSSLPQNASIVQFLTHGNAGGTESEAVSLMLSRAILKNAIDKLHLQAHIQADRDAEHFTKLARLNILLAWAAFKKAPKPVLKELCCPIKFESIKYDGEVPLSFKIELDETGNFQIFDVFSSRRFVGKGKLGEPFHFEDLSFTLNPSQSFPLEPQTFSLTVNSLDDTVKNIAKILNVKPSKLDKSLLVIKYENRNRHLASKVVNAIMESYQNYSKNFHNDMALHQLDYLNQRRDQLSENLISLMQKNANYIANDLYSSGFIESQKEMDFLAKSQHEYKRKLLDNELEIKRLTNIRLDNFAHYDRYSSNDGDPTVINTIFSELRSLKQQRDALAIETQKKSIHQGTNLQELFNQQADELKEVQQYFIDLQAMKELFQKGYIPDPQSKLLSDPRYLLKGWFERLKEAQSEGGKAAKETQENLQNYLNNLERLFGVHVRILQERLTHQQNPSGEYQGINLEMATNLYRDYSKQLIQMEGTIRQNVFFIDQIQDPNFEITSLSAGLNDAISNEIIHKAGQLVLRLRDQNNQSGREQERIKEELNLERTFLTLHLEQMVQLMELNKQLFDEKIYALQNVSLELLHQRITLLEKNLQDYLQARLDNLQQERTLIKRHLENIHNEMAQLPQKWVSEQLLTQEVATNHMIVEEIAKLVETKNISHNLEIIQSSPIDLSLPPFKPVTPKILLLGMLGIFFGGLVGSCYSLARSMDQGLKVTVSYLKQMGCHVSGYLTSPLAKKNKFLLGKNLETLRRLLSYFKHKQSEECFSNSSKQKLLLLIEGNSPHYAPFLAELFAKKGQKVIMLDLNFKHCQQKTSGILQVINGEEAEPLIQKGEHGEWIAAGGESHFVNEMLNSEAFQNMIEKLKMNYDWIIGVSRAIPGSVEAENLVPLFPFVALTIQHEKVDEINFYIQYLKTHPSHKMTFIFDHT